MEAAVVADASFGLPSRDARQHQLVRLLQKRLRWRVYYRNKQGMYYK